MKPIKLSIEGINSFSERQTLDFMDFGEGLFCISGKTGSGKTTILDSILIALYGDSGRTGKISDYINMGMNKAEVVFDFDIDGTVYEVKRILSRTASGKASLTKLGDGTLIADQPTTVNAAIMSLVGMDINTFTQVVILQQGEFDKFIHSSPAVRRDTVGKLFGLSRYEKLYNRFNSYAESLKSRITALDSAAQSVKYADQNKIAVLEKETEEITSLTLDAKKKLDESLKRKNELEVLKKLYDESELKRVEAGKLNLECEQLRAGLEQLGKEKEEYGIKFDLEKMREEEKKAMLELQRLKSLRPSLKLYADKKEELLKVRASFASLNNDLKKARESNFIMIGHRDEIVSVLKQTVSSITSGYSDDKYYGKEGFGELKTFLRGLKTDIVKAETIRQNIAEITAEKEEESKKRDAAAVALHEIAIRENEVSGELNVAEQELESKKHDLNDLMSVKALSSVIRELRIGDNCPVCGNKITFLKTADDSEFDETEKEIAEAEEKVKALNEKYSKIKIEAASIRENAAASEDRMAKCDLKLKGLHESVKLTPKANLKTLENAEKCCEMIDKTEPEILKSNHNIELITKELQNVKERGVSLRADLEKLDESLGQINSEADIDELISAAEERAAKLSSDIKNTEQGTMTLNNKIVDLEKQLEATGARLENLKEQLDQRIDYDVSEYTQIINECEEGEKKFSSLNAELAKKHAELEVTKRDAEVYKNIVGKKDKFVANADRAEKLAAIVKGDVFLDFVAREYVESFTDAASEIMQELSSGQYSLELNDKSDFLIRDFFRNNSLRGVRTLSGGETFLASLSMAVAISRELSHYSGNGFFFLDEGFGTLDNDYINTVYESLDRLSQETMVGLVTHCEELIELVGNGVEIEKSENGSGSKIIRK